MATGRNNQTIKQVGEYLVASELARRGFLVATFSGNVPDFDMTATDSKGKSTPIQVKTSRNGSWQFTINKFADISFSEKKQIIGKKIENEIKDFVLGVNKAKPSAFIEWVTTRKQYNRRRRFWQIISIIWRLPCRIAHGKTRRKKTRAGGAI